jgi:hypothetical protein
MTRKKLFILVGNALLIGIGFIMFFKIDASIFRRIYYKIENMLRSPDKLPPDSEREPFVFPEEGYGTSVEMALNSRCTSDYDGNPKHFHWGMFDKSKKLTEKQIGKLTSYIKVPRFTTHRLEIKTRNNILTFITENQVAGVQRDWLMIESGMQQQATGLVCAALGVGMVFRNMGPDGKNLSKTDHANIKIYLDAMKPSYGKSFWSSSSPSERKPWLQGNLPNPKRIGKTPLITALSELKTQKINSKLATGFEISQLLWAARGRTPHLYKSREWGMTIPTWAGEQHITEIYVVIKQNIYRYINWHKNRPSQRLEFVKEINGPLYRDIYSQLPSGNCFIFLKRNELQAKSSWEIGYQLLNMILQAHVLDISYEAILLNQAQMNMIQKTGLSNIASIMALYFSPDSQVIA